MLPIREKFSSQAAPEVLNKLRQIAEAEGRQFQAVLDEALREYIERKEKGQCHHFTRIELGLIVFLNIWQFLVNTVEQFYGKVFGSHGFDLLCIGLVANTHLEVIP